MYFRTPARVFCIIKLHWVTGRHRRLCFCYTITHCSTWPSASGQPAYGCICSYHGNDNAIFTAVVFNSGTRGESQSGACRRESATANEKAIWGELAYWHQAWRQREAVRSGSPNDGSQWTSARRHNSPSLSSVALPVLSITRLSDLNPFPSSLATPVVSQSAAHLIPHRGSYRNFFTF